MKKLTDKTFYVIMAVIMCLVMSTALVFPKIKRNVSMYQQMDSAYGENGLEEMEALAASVPADASVTASSSVAPHLYHVERVYIIMHNYDSLRDMGNDTDYYLLDTRYDTTELRSMMGSDYDMTGKAGSLELYKRR